MNLQQLEYIVAVDTHRHFEKAAEQCFVTQATLSMMIKKLEQELDVILFDRSKQPVVPTETGKAIIEQARVILKETQQLKLLSKEAKSGIAGELRIGVIPTVAPYLLPLFLTAFLKKFPAVKLKIVEQTTEHLLRLLSTDKLDVAIMATPLSEKGFLETHLFYEEFKVYVAETNRSLKKKYILAEDIDINKLWLLEEGHCLRSQVLNLCEIQKQQAIVHHLDYETGSIESLLKITEMNGGITIVPELATIHFEKKVKEKLRHFKPPVPVREISLVTYRHFVKKGLLHVLEKSIVQAVKAYLPQKEETDVIAAS
ncbi:hydrogen peroxide-inducible genes activator [Flavisolibacter nicotianae]|uniref:hydrogen peroxide-inducible genes activator n=1 Tax=Flavisolibacter nicotianae TaxID=2364882 RepID=UPI000EABACC4|nr:hydrogen peroxide-inducible genes activator [Flavisolibacter nicotianae]